MIQRRNLALRLLFWMVTSYLLSQRHIWVKHTQRCSTCLGSILVGVMHTFRAVVDGWCVRNSWTHVWWRMYWVLRVSESFCWLIHIVLILPVLSSFIGWMWATLATIPADVSLSFVTCYCSPSFCFFLPSSHSWVSVVCFSHLLLGQPLDLCVRFSTSLALVLLPICLPSWCYSYSFLLCVCVYQRLGFLFLVVVLSLLLLPLCYLSVCSSVLNSFMLCCDYLPLAGIVFSLAFSWEGPFLVADVPGQLLGRIACCSLCLLSVVAFFLVERGLLSSIFWSLLSS